METTDLNANSDSIIDEKQQDCGNVHCENSHLSGESVTIPLLSEKCQTNFSQHPPNDTLVTENRKEIEGIGQFAQRQSSNVIERETSNEVKVNRGATEPHVKFATSPADVKAIKKCARTIDTEKGENLSQFAKFRKKHWGWVVVVASWIVMIPVAGTLSSFGTIVESLAEEFNASKLETGWIGSLAFSFTVGTCPISTPLFTIFGGRKVAFFGVIVGSASLLITSFLPIIYLMFVTYSTMYGISANLIYNSAMSLSGQYFPSKHQALATCLASAGISFGTLSMNPFGEYLVSAVGWRNTLRVFSGIVLVIGLLCVASFSPVKTLEQKLVTKLKHAKEKERNTVLEQAVGSHPELDTHAITESLQNCNESKISLAAQEIKKSVFDKRMYDCSVCNNPSFLLWMFGTLFWSLSFLFPLIFLIDYMRSIDIPASSGALVMTSFGIAEFVGRVLCAAFADKIKFSFAYVYAVSCGFMGIATLLAPLGTNLTVMFAYAISVGVNSGIVNSMMFAATMQIFGNEKGQHIWGYINVMLALGMVIGPVSAGGIFDVTQSYKAAFYMGGGMFILSGITMLLIPIAGRFFPQKEREAKGKREVKLPVSNRIVKPRRSLRSLVISQQLNRSKVNAKSKWNSGAMSDLQELDELHKEYQDGEIVKHHGDHIC